MTKPPRGQSRVVGARLVATRAIDAQSVISTGMESGTGPGGMAGIATRNGAAEAHGETAIEIANTTVTTAIGEAGTIVNGPTVIDAIMTGIEGG
jgi:hypothetical protein